jgi:hypothetical protein
VVTNSRRTVELKTVTVRRVDERTKRYVSREFLRTASEPLYIEVQTARPLGNLARGAAPVILLNSERLLDTRATSPSRLIAFLPDRERLKETNRVAVVWLGDRATQTRRPLTFRLEDIRR